MILTSLLLLPLVKTILKDRKEYFEWRDRYEIK